MGFIDSVKGILTKKKQPKPELPPEPPKKEVSHSSDMEVMPPPKVTDFDDEIPELPDLELPEELSKEKPVSPPEPQPKSPVVPPPQERTTQQGAETPTKSISIEPPPSDDGPGNPISFEKINTPKLKKQPVESTPSQPKEPAPKKVPVKDTTFVKPEGHEFIREYTFAQIVQGLNEMESMVTKSQRFDTIMELNSQKQKSIEAFQKEVKGVLSTLNQIDNIAFKKR